MVSRRAQVTIFIIVGIALVVVALLAWLLLREPVEAEFVELTFTEQNLSFDVYAQEVPSEVTQRAEAVLEDARDDLAEQIASQIRIEAREVGARALSDEVDRLFTRQIIGACQGDCYPDAGYFADRIAEQVAVALRGGVVGSSLALRFRESGYPIEILHDEASVEPLVREESILIEVTLPVRAVGGDGFDVESVGVVPVRLPTILRERDRLREVLSQDAIDLRDLESELVVDLAPSAEGMVAVIADPSSSVDGQRFSCAFLVGGRP